MISRINQLLSPIERLIQKSARYIGYLCILLSVASGGILYYALTQLSDDFGTYNEMVGFTGEQSMNVLWLLLFLPIFARVFGLGIARALMPLRKELGILMGVLALIHATIYLAPYPGDLLEPTFWWSNGMPTYLSYGFAALVLTIPLLLTSSQFMMRILGRHWKTLHRIVYIIIILTVAHVVILKSMRHIEWGLIASLVIYIIGKVLEWTGISFAPKQDLTSYPKGQKWLCVPCGYIYDPLVGDEDNGVAPGTEFVDIPADWRCPVCGVTKVDFVPYDENIQTPSYDARVVSNTFLNPNTVELVIDLSIPLVSVPGQFMTFVWHDDASEFTRSYSIVEQSGSRYTFLIKLSDLGRGARIIRTLMSDATVRIRGIYGSFVLQTGSEAPKVFIATGTGLAPVYNMIKSLPDHTKKALFFSVSTQADLFYVEQLRAIPNLILSIHVTREQVPGYQSGRVDVASIDVGDTVEWYLCGNPSMISEAREKLSAKQFTKVYSEEF